MQYDIFYTENNPKMLPPPINYTPPINYPPPITINSITKMKNKHQLLELEHKYDNFLQKNQHLLLLHDIIEDYLDIRDTLIIQIQRIQREERRQQYRSNSESIYTSHTEFNDPIKYSHDFQHLLPPALRLNPVQILQGYIPYPNEPKEYKCGCLSIKYYSPCACRRSQTTDCKKPGCNEKRFPMLKSHAYCRSHARLILTQTDLEKELKKVKQELSYIRRNSNSLDYDDYQESLSNHQVTKRVSRFPWKN